MKRLLTLVAILLASCSLASAQQSRNITNFDKDWEFSLGEEKKSWRKLDLPHDWSIEVENLLMRIKSVLIIWFKPMTIHLESTPII